VRVGYAGCDAVQSSFLMYYSCLQGVRPIGAIKSIQLAFAIGFGFVLHNMSYVFTICLFLPAAPPEDEIPA